MYCMCTIVILVLSVKVYYCTSYVYRFHYARIDSESHSITFTHAISLVYRIPGVHAGEDYPHPEVGEMEMADEYLLLAVQNLSTTSPNTESKDESLLNSSSESSVPQSVSISRFGFSHSGILTGQSSTTSWEMDDVSWITHACTCTYECSKCNQGGSRIYTCTYVRTYVHACTYVRMCVLSIYM